jgi:hypothetical protein
MQPKTPAQITTSQIVIKLCRFCLPQPSSIWSLIDFCGCFACFSCQSPTSPRTCRAQFCSHSAVHDLHKLRTVLQLRPFVPHLHCVCIIAVFILINFAAWPRSSSCRGQWLLVCKRAWRHVPTWVLCLQTYRYSAVGIPTRYGLDGPGIESRWGLYFPHPCRPGLGPTQSPIQWVPGLSWG